MLLGSAVVRCYHGDGVVAVMRVQSRWCRGFVRLDVVEARRPGFWGVGNRWVWVAGPRRSNEGMFSLRVGRRLWYVGRFTHAETLRYDRIPEVRS